MISKLVAIMFPELNRPTIVMSQQKKPAGGTKPKISQVDEPDCFEAPKTWNQNDRRFYRWTAIVAIQYFYVQFFSSRTIRWKEVELAGVVLPVLPSLMLLTKQGLYWGYTGIMKNKMETTIVHWGYIGKCLTRSL